MKFAWVAACVGLSVVRICAAGMMPSDIGAPELKGALRCEIRLATNNVVLGSRLPVFVTLENTSTLEAELPAPYSSEPGVHVRAFVLAGQATGVVQRLVIPCLALPSDLSPKQRDMLEKNRAEIWHLLLETLPTSWISIPGHGKAEFLVFVEISPKTDSGEVPPAGTYGLQCEIEYYMHSITSTAFIETNQSTSVEFSAKAKASGVFLLDVHSLWTGKMESNVAQINVIESPK
jgi:hypothetical protein